MKQFYKLGGALLIQLSLLSSASATDRLVTNMTQLNSAVSASVAGDNIILQNGTWNNAAITFSGSGSSSNPITMKAQTPGGVTFTGNSTMNVTGTYLVVKGFKWTNGTVSGNVVTIRGGNNRITQCAIINFNSGSKWIVLDGLRGKVDHCHFEGKNTVDPTMQIEVKDKTADYHIVEYNHFAKREPLGANGGETVRVGYSGQMDNISRTIFQYNLFQECDGENEIISNKSCENLYQFNTFRRSVGQFCFRHGDRNILYGNWFLGEGKANTGGVRVIGSGNYIVNNFFHGLDAANSTGDAVIILQKGETYPAGEVRFNPQVVGCVIAYNTVSEYTSGRALDVNNGSRPLSPTGVKVANNIFVDANQSLIANNLTGSETWQGNIAFGTLGITNPGGITMDDPELEAAGSWRIGATSPAIDAGVGGWGGLLDISGLGVDVNVSKDIDGHTRTSSKDVGCDERVTGNAVNRPLLPADVGPSWLGGPADPEEPAGPENVALNKTVTASSEPQPENPASSAVDGNTATRWSATGYPQWLEVDLGAEYSISKTEVICMDDRAYQFTVSSKTTSGGSYTQIVNRNTNTTPGTIAAPITNSFTAINARYVRINVTGASGYTGPWTSIPEFRVFGVPTGSLMLAAKAPEETTSGKETLDVSVYPNPVVSPSATIRYSLPAAAQVSLAVYNMNGQPEILVNGQQPAGKHNVQWNTGGKANGVYIIRLRAGNIEKQYRLMLSK
ncbi:chondroitinase-B domain-containing protein [Chitinophaga barathri]|uniref:T9SS C-terminal target domain-containing protein n=1 Tax=Chitinophaga barathri TaxID=1647451 RepID=A0A3N4M9H4_9BACT|nr:chondroitinase-B domain-containing protein [Chitinophaga barathri]RPD38276.1 T9SS C-terminal target domain-containing protein [Chitinophaga barathri]